MAKAPDTAPVAVNDTYNVYEDDILKAGTGGTDDVLDNDTDADPGDKLSAVLASGPLINPLFSLQTNGSFTFDARNYDYLGDGETITDTFTYWAFDGQKFSLTTALVTIYIHGINDDPVALNDTYIPGTLKSGGSIDIDVLANDSDVDRHDVNASNYGDTLTITSFTDINDNNGHPVGGSGASITTDAGGTVSILANQVHYVADANFFGVDTFTYTISDGHGGSATATVSVTVNPNNGAPDAVIDSYNVDENTPLTVNAADGVLDNDTDPNGDLLGAQLSSDLSPDKGILKFNSDGSFTYDPNGEFAYLSAGQEALVTFTYTAYDGSGLSDTATVTLHVQGANSAPVATDDTNWAQEDTSNAGGNVLQTLDHSGAPDSAVRGDAEDTDTDDSDTLSVTDFSHGATTQSPGSDLAGDHGTLTLNGDGSYSYTVNNSDSVVNALDDGDTTTDTFTYTLSDGTATDTATLTVTIFGSNDSPVANDDTNWAKEDTSDATGNVLQTIDHSSGAPSGSFGDAADTDVDDSLTVAKIGLVAVAGGAAGSDFTGAHGTLTMHQDGSYSYAVNNADSAVQALDDGETTTDTFTYTASDGSVTDTADLTITVFGTNDAPDGNNDGNTGDPVVEAGVNPGNTADPGNPNAAGDVLDNDTDEDTNHTLTVFAVEGSEANVGVEIDGTYGSITINEDGTYTYTLDNNDLQTNALAQDAPASDSFDYTVEDEHGATSNATLTIDITGTNDPPVGNADTNWAKLNETNAAGNVLLTASHTGAPSGTYGDVADTDPDTDAALTVTKVGGSSVAAGAGGSSFVGAHGTLTMHTDGSYGYIVNANDVTFLDTNVVSVPDAFTYTVSDEFGATATATLTVTVFNTLQPLSLADRFFINEIDLIGGGTAHSNAIELINNYNNAVSGSDLAQAKVEIRNPNGDLIVVDLGKLLGLTVKANGTPIGGSALPGNSVLVLYEPSAEHLNGYWRVISGNTEKNGEFAVGNRLQWDLGNTVSDKLAVNLIQQTSSLDLFVANGVSLAGLTGVGTIGYGHHDLGSVSPFLLPDRSAAWYGGAETPASGISPDDTSLIAANNLQYNGSLGGPSDNVFARAYDRYLTSSKGSSVDNVFADNNDSGDWTYNHTGTLGTKNNSPTATNSQDATDNVNPAQGTNAAGNVNPDITNENGQTVAALSGAGTLNGGPGPDFLYGSTSGDVLNGASNNDFLYGSAGNDNLNGGSGADVLRGGAGDDTADGGSGIDVIDFSDGTSGLTFTLTQSALDTIFNAAAAGLGSDTYRNMEGVIGTSFADTLNGTTSADRLIGGGGNDTESGSDGNDTEDGGVGNDNLTGGTGSDQFVFSTTLGAGNVDVVADLVHAVDKIVLDASVFTALLAGPLSAADFKSGAAPTPADSSDHILYNTTTGALSYDSDGTGAAAAVQFATLTNLPAGFDATDILII